MPEKRFPPEDEDFIMKLYREAAHPEKQIKILAELLATKQDSILSVLEQRGTIAAEKVKAMEKPEKKPGRGGYPIDFRKMVAAKLFTGSTASELAREYGVTPGTVSKWGMQYPPTAGEVQQEQPPAPTPTMRAAPPPQKTEAEQVIDLLAEIRDIVQQIAREMPLVKLKGE